MSTAEGTTLPAWQLAAATVPGLAHLRRGLGNEDAYLSVTLPDRTLLLAVADGAGSARHAAAASQLAVEQAAARLASCELPVHGRSWKPLFRRLLDEVRSQLLAATVAAAGRQEATSKHDYATTLLLAVVGPRWCAALQLGDGAIVLRRSDGGLERATEGSYGPHAGETVFLTSEDYRAQARLSVRPAAGITGLALLTDGLEPLALRLRENEPHAPFFEPLFRFAADPRQDDAAKREELTAFLASERLAERSHDDKTLLLAVRA